MSAVPSEPAEQPPRPYTTPLGAAEALLTPGAEAFGRVWPTKPGQPLSDLGAREAALRTLRRFISLLEFRRTGDVGGPSVPFRVPEAYIHVYEPDTVQQAQGWPLMGFIPTRAEKVPYGLGPAVLLDDTMDRYCPGTALVRLGDHVENLTIEVYAAGQAERRAVVAGLEEVLRLNDRSQAIQLRALDYYDRVVAVRLDASEQLDDADASINRRSGHLYVELTVPEVKLVNVREFLLVQTQCVEPG